MRFSPSGNFLIMQRAAILHAKWENAAGRFIQSGILTTSARRKLLAGPGRALPSELTV